MYLKCLNRHTERGIALALRQIGWLVSKQIRNLLNFISKVSIQPYINILKNKVFIKESAKGAKKNLTIFFSKKLYLIFSNYRICKIILFPWHFYKIPWHFHDFSRKIKFHDISMTFHDKNIFPGFPWHVWTLHMERTYIFGVIYEIAQNSYLYGRDLSYPLWILFSIFTWKEHILAILRKILIFSRVIEISAILSSIPLIF